MKQQLRIQKPFAYIDKEILKVRAEMDRWLPLIEFSVASDSEELYEL